MTQFKRQKMAAAHQNQQDIFSSRRKRFCRARLLINYQEIPRRGSAGVPNFRKRTSKLRLELINTQYSELCELFLSRTELQ